METIHEKYRFRDTLPLSARSIDVSCRNFQFKFFSTVTLSFSIQFVDWTGLCLWCLGEKRNYYTIDPVKSTIYNFISHHILFLRFTKKELFELIFIKKFGKNWSVLLRTFLSVLTHFVVVLFVCLLADEWKLQALVLQSPLNLLRCFKCNFQMSSLFQASFKL